MALLLVACLSLVSSQGVIGSQTFENGSKCIENCGTLYVTTNTGEEKTYTGTKRKMRQKNVAKVRVVGTGCFLIHKERGFSGENFLVQGSKEHDLRENGHDWTTVKSVEYSLDCQFGARKAGAALYVIAGVGGLVVVICGLLVLKKKLEMRRRGGETVVAQQDGTSNLQEDSSIIRNTGEQEC